MFDIDDDCTVVTDMPLCDEVCDYIEKGLHRDMTDKDVIDWCDNNVLEISEIYEKYRGTRYSYTDAEHVLFFTQTVYGRDDMGEMVRTFVACQ
jgi:hypothetical protein